MGGQGREVMERAGNDCQGRQESEAIGTGTEVRSEEQNPWRTGWRGWVCWGQGADPGLGMRPRLCRPASHLGRRRRRHREGELEKAALGGEPGQRPDGFTEGDPSPTPARPAGPAPPRLGSPRLTCSEPAAAAAAAAAAEAAAPGGASPGDGAERGRGRGRLSAVLGVPLPPAAVAAASRPGPSRPGPARILLGRRRRRRQRQSGELPTMHCAASISTSPDITSSPPRLLHHRPCSDITVYSAPFSTPAALGLSLVWTCF